MDSQELPGCPVVRTWHFYCQGHGLIPGWGTKILQASWYSQKKKKKKDGLYMVFAPTFFFKIPNITGYIKINCDFITSSGENCFSYPKYLEWNKSNRKLLL